MDPNMFYADPDDTPDDIPDDATICRASLPDLARHLKTLRDEGRYTWGQVAAYINPRIYSFAWSPIVAEVFLNVFDVEDAIASALRQGQSAPLRRLAMNLFKEKCRSTRFQAMWNSIGAIPGLMALMSTMSVRDISRLCKCIGECTPKTTSIVPSEKYFTKLLASLRNTDGNNPSLTLKNPDTRPLDSYYNKILPACEPHMIFDEVAKIEKNGSGKKITPYRFVLDGNDIQFSVNVMMRLSLNPDSLKTNADNLIQDLAHPLARRLNNRREGDHLQALFYSSLIDCLRKEPSIVDKLDHVIISYAIKAWGRAHKRRDYIKRQLAVLLRLATDNHRWTLGRVADELRHVKLGLRPELLRLLLRSARPFKVDINLPFAIDRGVLKSLGKAWPSRLFYLLPSRLSLRLFKILRAIHPDGKFIAKDHSETRGADCINKDYQQYGDPDMIFALLQSRQHLNDSCNTAGSIETQIVLRQRKCKAMSMRNGEDMAIWVRSAVLLSIASRSLFLYEDTVLWARRFGGDPLVAKTLLSSDTLLSQGGLDMLSGISRPLLKNYSSLTQLKDNVERADRILMQHVKLLASHKKLASTLLQGIFNVFLLLSLVIQRRMEHLHAFKKGAGLSDDDIYNSV
ncbi:hypothetical protein F4805DRAFT_457109 [Annulohypoxylon moriforme]|nr:hypothetical protein F4805DRAFT_457109 [Annulohypoxylon moriforme]